MPRLGVETTVPAALVATVVACSYPNPEFGPGTTSGPGVTSVTPTTTSSGTSVANTGEATGTSSSGGDQTSEQASGSGSESATTDDTGSQIGSPCAGRDWTVVTWERIEPVSTEAHELDPFLLADGRTLLYTSYGDWGHSDILAATRAAPGDPFTASPHDGFFGLNTDDDEFRVELSSDGLRAYFAARRGATETDVYFAERDDINADFGDAVPIIAGLDHDHDPHLSDDELELFYAPATDGQSDIWLTTRASARDPFPPGSILAGVNDPTANDSNPSLSRDGLILVFASARAGLRDVFVSRRASPAQPFGAPVPAPDPINDPDAVDGDPFIADDHEVCELFWFSGRRGALGQDLFRAELAPIP